MNLKQVKDKTLAYIDEYSVDGVIISDGENADYLKKIPMFANDAQKEISDKIGIESSTTFDLSTYSSSNYYFKISLPNDFKQFISMNLDDEPFFDFKILNGEIIIDKSYAGKLELIYDKNPTFLDNSTLDSYEFEIDDHAQPLLPFYIGGMIKATEDFVLSDKLLNIYYSRLASLKKKSHNYVSEIEVE